MLVIVAVVADTLISGTNHLDLRGISVSPTSAVLFAMFLVAVHMATTLASSVIASRLSAHAMVAAQESLAASYLATSHEAKSVRGTGDLATVIINHGRQTGDLANTYSTVAAAICGLPAFGGMSLLVNPIATLGIAAIGGFVLALMQPLRNRSKKAAHEFSGVSRDPRVGPLVQPRPTPQPLRRHPTNRIRSSVLCCTTSHPNQGWKE